MSAPHYVYRCYDAEDRLLYIGCTENLEQRMRVHDWDTPNRASFELMRRMVRCEYEEHPDRESDLRAEREAIMAEAPMLNTHHNLGRGMRALPPVERTSNPEAAAGLRMLADRFGSVS